MFLAFRSSYFPGHHPASPQLLTSILHTSEPLSRSQQHLSLNDFAAVGDVRRHTRSRELAPRAGKNAAPVLHRPNHLPRVVNRGMHCVRDGQLDDGVPPVFGQALGNRQRQKTCEQEAAGEPPLRKKPFANPLCSSRRRAGKAGLASDTAHSAGTLAVPPRSVNRWTQTTHTMVHFRA